MTLTYQERQRMKDLGIFLKATRNRFYFSPRHNSYIRIRSIDENREFFEAESCPASEIPQRADSRRKERRMYIVLDNEDERKSVFQSLPFSRKDTQTYRTWKLHLVEDKLQVVE